MSRNDRLIFKEILKELKKEPEPQKASVWERWGLRVSIFSTLLTVVFGVLTYNLTVKYGENRELVDKIGTLVESQELRRIEDVRPKFKVVESESVASEFDGYLIQGFTRKIINEGETAYVDWIDGFELIDKELADQEKVEPGEEVFFFSLLVNEIEYTADASDEPLILKMQYRDKDGRKYSMVVHYYLMVDTVFRYGETSITASHLLDIKEQRLL